MVLVSAFAAYGIATVQADPYDFLWAVVTVDPIGDITVDIMMFGTQSSLSL